MTKGFFDDVDFDIDCPNCHAEIKLQDKNFKSEIKAANKAMKDLEKTLNSFK